MPRDRSGRGGPPWPTMFRYSSASARQPPDERPDCSSMSDGPPAQSRLGGVRLGRLQRHADERGAFRELWRESTFGELSPRDTGATADPTAEPAGGPRFVQANLSTSRPGVLR